MCRHNHVELFSGLDYTEGVSKEEWTQMNDPVGLHILYDSYHYMLKAVAGSIWMDDLRDHALQVAREVPSKKAADLLELATMLDTTMKTMHEVLSAELESLRSTPEFQAHLVEQERLRVEEELREKEEEATRLAIEAALKKDQPDRWWEDC